MGRHRWRSLPSNGRVAGCIADFGRCGCPDARRRFYGLRMSNTDASWFLGRANWPFVTLWSLVVGCGGADSPWEQPPTTTIDAASSPVVTVPDRAVDAGVKDARAAELEPIDAGAFDAHASDGTAWDASAADAGTLDATSWDSGLSEAGAQEAGHASPSPDASLQDADASRLTTDSGTDAAPGHADAMPQAHVVHVDSKAEWTPSGFRVEAGRCYSVQAKIDDVWLDLDVKANLEGWVDQSDLRIPLFALFRRVQQNNIGFYQFASCVNRKLDQCFPIGASSNVCPRISGELFFFVNDVPGFESNNVGTATVMITRK